MEAIQLELFEVPETERIAGEVRTLEKSIDNVRRGIFARHEELAKKYMELRQDVERLNESIHIMREEIRAYREAFVSVGAGLAGLSGLRSTVFPVSSLMMDSQACSTALSGPNHR